MKLGIFNYITDGFRWRHLIFYEVDHSPTPEDNKKILNDMSKARSAFIAYTTNSGGYHIMGLTPVSTIVWAYAFKDIDMDLHGNCSGHVLRVNRKPAERQEVFLAAGFHNYPLADQIYQMVRRKFKLNGYYSQGVDVQKWKSLFCIYDKTSLPPFRPRPFKRQRAQRRTLREGLSMLEDIEAMTSNCRNVGGPSQGGSQTFSIMSPRGKYPEGQ